MPRGVADDDDEAALRWKALLESCPRTPTPVSMVTLLSASLLLSASSTIGSDSRNPSIIHICCRKALIRCFSKVVGQSIERHRSSRSAIFASPTQMGSPFGRDGAEEEEEEAL